MNAPRTPVIGDRVRARPLYEDPQEPPWQWATVIDVRQPIEAGERLILTYVIDGKHWCTVIAALHHYGDGWRFPEDDPAVCTERPVIKGEDE